MRRQATGRDSAARRAALALATAVLVVSGACGTREDGSAAPAATESNAGPGGGAQATTPDTGAGGGATESQPAATGSADAPAAGSQGPAGTATAGGSGSTAGAARSNGGTQASPNGSGATGAGANPRQGSAASQGPNSPSAAGSGKGGPAPTVTTAPGGGPVPGGAVNPPGTSPVVVANVGTVSGPAGTVLAPVVAGVQMWVKAVNARGGVNGHPVKIIAYDDGGDPARHRSQVQEAIEKQGAIAFVGNPEALGGKGSVEYITQKRVPVIGSETGDNWFYESPMYFPQASSGDANFKAIIHSVGGQVLPAGKKKLGTITCAEVQGCADADKIFAQLAPGIGFTHAYRARASLAQPDFTAECLSARNNGVDVFLVIMDTNSQGRVGTACARQGFKPIFASGSAPIVDRFKDDPNLDNMVGVSNVFPWFATGTPAFDEYQSAFKSFGGGTSNGLAPALGWVAGKLFEKAAANLPEPPTSAAVLAGLWSLKKETLGGLTEPLTFTENQNAKPTSCWFDIAIKGKKWVSPDGGKLHCVE